MNPSPLQSLDFIYGLAKNAPVNYDTHAQAQMAYNLLKEVLTPKEEKPAKK